MATFCTAFLSYLVIANSAQLYRFIQALATLLFLALACIHFMRFFKLSRVLFLSFKEFDLFSEIEKEVYKFNDKDSQK